MAKIKPSRTDRNKIRPARWASFLGLTLLVALPAAGLHAQAVVPDAATLAKYDTNHNGRLDADELAAKQADDAKMVKPVVVSSAPAPTDEIVEMSPFEVSGAGDRGYYGANTMSGTRINSKIEDLASSVTVVTKEQMADFAMLDINDIFAYEASTEGSYTYTDVSFNSSAQPQDNLAQSPNTANRIRGLNTANVSLGAFETSNRVRIDPSMVDSVEINRGPNSNIFGLGNASGTVNLVPSGANASRDKSQVQFRGDSFGGYRDSLDVNRVILKNKLAVRVNQVFEHTDYVLKPSGTDTQRYSGMVRYLPFKSTTITASFSNYRVSGRRPNAVTPRDGVSPWLAEGSPTWDPTTSTAYIAGSPVNKNGVKVTTLGAGIPTINGAAAFSSAYQTSGRGQSLMYVDQGGVAYWTAPRNTNGTNPVGPLTDISGFNLVQLNPNTIRANQPLWQSDAAIGDKALYDWSSINAIAMNQTKEQVRMSMVNLSQVFFDTPRQMLAAQASWFRENSPVWHQESQSGGPSGSTYLYIDVNQKRLDGTPNPYYLRPYFGVAENFVLDTPMNNDTYRAQLAYKLDLTKEHSFLKWLGLHQVSAYGEYKNFESRRYLGEYAMLDNHSWLPANSPRATSSALTGDTLPQDQAAPFGTRSFTFYYVGDNKGNNVDYAPAPITPGVYPFNWGNFQSGAVHAEPVQYGPSASINGTGAANSVLKIQKTEGVVLQSHLIGDRVVTTMGLRKDKVYTKGGANPQLLPDGQTQNFAVDERWATGDYNANQGLTRTVGAVVRPLRWLSFYADKSDSFIPANPAINLHGQLLPNPQGKGQDWGFALNLFGGKLVLRANQYTTRQANSRDGNSTTLATRAIKVDIFDGATSRNFALDVNARNWLAATKGLSGAALDAAVAQTMKMNPALISLLENTIATNPGYIAESTDKLSKGREFELNYNPTNYWTIKANVSQNETIVASIAKDLTDYLAERMPIWQSIIDQQTGQPWFSSSYAGGTTAERYLPANVNSSLAVALQKQGKSDPQIRKYAANLSTNYRLSGITENKILRRFNVGGAVRWVDKGGIGYYGVEQLPATITALDPNRPVYDKAHTYVDLLIGYRTKLFRDRVGATFQLNVRNVQENGARLQPASALPDGTPNAYRIVDPRQFILSATFDL